MQTFPEMLVYCVSPREISQSVLTLEPACILFEAFSRD